MRRTGAVVGPRGAPSAVLALAALVLWAGAYSAAMLAMGVGDGAKSSTASRAASKAPRAARRAPLRLNGEGL